MEQFMPLINKAVVMEPTNENYKKIQKQIQDAVNNAGRSTSNPRGPGAPKSGGNSQ